MKKTEVISILGVIAAAYPNMKEITEVQIDVWYHSLKDMEAKAVQIAVQQYILEGTFPPSVAEIRQRAINITQPELPEKTEAWNEVQEAIKRYGYAREKEAMESMSEVTRKTAKSMGWREICHSQKPDVVRGQFLRMYDSMAEREKTDRIMPLELKEQTRKMRELTAGLSNKMQLENKGEK